MRSIHKHDFRRQVSRSGDFFQHPPQHAFDYFSCESMPECAADRCKARQILRHGVPLYIASLWLAVAALFPQHFHRLSLAYQKRPLWATLCLEGSLAASLQIRYLPVKADRKRVTDCPRSQPAQRYGRKRRFPRSRCRPNGCRHGYRRLPRQPRTGRG